MNKFEFIETIYFFQLLLDLFPKVLGGCGNLYVVSEVISSFNHWVDPEINLCL